jgi:hypothetical protein
MHLYIPPGINAERYDFNVACVRMPQSLSSSYAAPEWQARGVEPQKSIDGGLSTQGAYYILSLLLTQASLNKDPSSEIVT